MIIRKKEQAKQRRKNAGNSSFMPNGNQPLLRHRMRHQHRQVNEEEKMSPSPKDKRAQEIADIIACRHTVEPLTPLEIAEAKLREKTIAEIRGYRKGHRFSDTPTILTSDAAWDDTNGEWFWLRDNSFPVTCPKWTTSNNDAWELWNELPDGRCYTQHGDAHFITLHNQEHYMTVKGTSFADAVSKAWLQYKEKAVKMAAQT